MTGKALRALRKKHGLSVAKAAAMVSVAPRTWVRWETLRIVAGPGPLLFRMLVESDKTQK